MRSLVNTLAALAVAAGTLIASPPATADVIRTPVLEYGYGVIGDSITWGYGSRVPYARVAGVAHHGVPGACTSSSRCGDWCTFDPAQDGRCGADLWMDDALEEMGRPDTLFVLLGTNDLLLGSSPGQVKRGLRALRDKARRLGVERVVFGTIPPTASDLARHDTDTRRTVVNDWIRRGDYVDYASALENADGSLPARYDAGDGLHVSTAGERVMGHALRAWIDAH